MTEPPLPPQTRYWSRPADRQQVVSELFDRSAEHYDRACDLLAFGCGQSYRRKALIRAGLRPGMDVLDVGTGTGLVAREAAGLLGSSGRIIGLDPSLRMMTSGHRVPTVCLVQGMGERLPFADRRFDFVVMGYALRHVTDLDETFAEYGRVLRPGGRALLLEITRPSSPPGRLLARCYFGSAVPWLTRIATRSADAAELMRFYWETILQCVPPEKVLASLQRSGFAEPRRTVICGIFSEYVAARAV